MKKIDYWLIRIILILLTAWASWFTVCGKRAVSEAVSTGVKAGIVDSLVDQTKPKGK